MEGLTAESLALSVMDALTSHICVVDTTGEIVAVNRAWKEFYANNAGSDEKSYLGTNYLDICQTSTGPASAEASVFGKGMLDVLKGRTNVFQIEYPCHSATEFRWFLARVTPLIQRHSGERVETAGAVVSHMNITDRRLVELENSRLASTDPLTDLPNRRFFEQYATIEFERFRRFGGEISVLMFDLDKFKLINDTHGHLAGDAVLKKVAASCKSAVRGSDLFARIGGEEFVALLPGTNEAGAMHLAEYLRSMVEGLKIETEAGTLRVTSSIGVASVMPKDRSIKTALNRADKALYSAKSAGRNRVKRFAVKTTQALAL